MQTLVPRAQLEQELGPLRTRLVGLLDAPFRLLLLQILPFRLLEAIALCRRQADPQNVRQRVGHQKPAETVVHEVVRLDELNRGRAKPGHAMLFLAGDLVEETRGSPHGPLELLRGNLKLAGRGGDQGFVRQQTVAESLGHILSDLLTVAVRCAEYRDDSHDSSGSGGRHAVPRPGAGARAHEGKQHR